MNISRFFSISIKLYTSPLLNWTSFFKYERKNHFIRENTKLSSIQSYFEWIRFFFQHLFVYKLPVCGKQKEAALTLWLAQRWRCKQSCELFTFKLNQRLNNSIEIRWKWRKTTSCSDKINKRIKQLKTTNNHKLKPIFLIYLIWLNGWSEMSTGKLYWFHALIIHLNFFLSSHRMQPLELNFVDFSYYFFSLPWKVNVQKKRWSVILIQYRKKKNLCNNQ